MLHLSRQLQRLSLHSSSTVSSRSAHFSLAYCRTNRLVSAKGFVDRSVIPGCFPFASFVAFRPASSLVRSKPSSIMSTESTTTTTTTAMAAAELTTVSSANNNADSIDDATNKRKAPLAPSENDAVAAVKSARVDSTTAAVDKRQERREEGKDRRRGNNTDRGGSRAASADGSSSGGGSDKKKLKVSMIVGYNGSGYRGLQVNPGTETIEQELETTLYKLGYISDDNHGDLHKIAWSRAARTDKGVHAAANVVAFKLLLGAEETFEDVRARLNAALPTQIRVLNIARSMNSFDAKTSASSRTYEYIIPSFAFLPLSEYPPGVVEAMVTTVPTVDEGAQMRVSNAADATETEEEKKRALEKKLQHQQEQQQQQQQQQQKGEYPAAEVGETKADGGSAQAKNVNASNNSKNNSNKKGSKHHSDDDDVDEDEDAGASSSSSALAATQFSPTPLPAELKAYRMTPELRARVDEILSVYVGTKNHHNFTKGRPPHDPSCKRYIDRFETTGFFTLDGMEFVHMVVHGQSFMLHQVRQDVCGTTCASIALSLTLSVLFAPIVYLSHRTSLFPIA